MATKLYKDICSWCGRIVSDHGAHEKCRMKERKLFAVNEIQINLLKEQVYKIIGDKVDLWFSTKNPALGGMSPNEMIKRGYMNGLTKFVENATREEESAKEALAKLERIKSAAEEI